MNKQKLDINNTRSVKSIGITGQNGFIGRHLFNTLGLFPEKYKRIAFDKEWFQNEKMMDDFVSQCDVIVHLAAMNRHSDPEIIYNTNIKLVQKLITSLNNTGSKAHVLFSSSSQEEQNNLYGKSKKEGRELLINWAEKSGGKFTAFIIPNVFGPFGRPNYNSFIATFCHKLTHNEVPHIDKDAEVNLIYVGELVQEIIKQIDVGESNYSYKVSSTATKKVSEVLSLLNEYKATYFTKGEIPPIQNVFEHNLFNTYRSYIDHQAHFPIKFMQHKDPRGAFVEVIRLGIGGQCSFSTTVPGITRGNHYHTRKIERFAVIKGKALIQLRKIDSDQVFDFYIEGNEPAYVDMPIWYTHNIKNIGDEELYTIFWIDEPYNPEDSDTYFLEV